MKRILFVLPAVLCLGQFGHAQYYLGEYYACLSAGGTPIVQDPISGCSVVETVSASPDSTSVKGWLSGPANTLDYSGTITGDLGGGPTSGSVTSIPCQPNRTQISSTGFGFAPLYFGTVYGAGAHGITMKILNPTGAGGCSGAANNYTAQLTIIAIPPNPVNNPSPTCGSVMVDPVKSNLLQGSAVTSNEAAILSPSAATSPVFVTGVAADGVTQTVVAVPTQNLGDSVQLNLINDANSPSSSSDQDGGLAKIGGGVTSLSNSVSLVADTTSVLGPTAFAIYRAPTNYARGSQNFPQDNTSVQRAVSLQTICIASGGSPSSPTNTPATIVRPLVVLVHGLWSDPSSWSNFAPTASSPEAQMWSALKPNVAIFPADYSAPVVVGSTVPAFSNMSQVSGNALGLQYNAPIVLAQVRNAIGSFGSYFNVAAVQADVIGHSMGGLITRTMAVPNEPWTFLTNDTYGQGPIEKLVTIGTPHLGSPLALDLLPSGTGQDPNACFRNALAPYRDVAIQSANVGGASVNGGVNDVEGDGQDTTGLSLALQSLVAYQSVQPFPMAYLAGTLSSANLAGLNCTACKASYLRNLKCRSSPLAQDLTAAGWPSVFGTSNPSDGIVPLTSQLNGSSTGNPTTGVIHSSGLEGLDFAGPSELDPGVIAVSAVDLLNEAKSGGDFQH